RGVVPERHRVPGARVHRTTATERGGPRRRKLQPARECRRGRQREQRRRGGERQPETIRHQQPHSSPGEHDESGRRISKACTSRKKEPGPVRKIEGSVGSTCCWVDASTRLSRPRTPTRRRRS